MVRWRRKSKLKRSDQKPCRKIFYQFHRIDGLHYIDTTLKLPMLLPSKNLDEPKKISPIYWTEQLRRFPDLRMLTYDENDKPLLRILHSCREWEASPRFGIQHIK